MTFLFLDPGMPAAMHETDVMAMLGAACPKAKAGTAAAKKRKATVLDYFIKNKIELSTELKKAKPMVLQALLNIYDISAMHKLDELAESFFPHKHRYFDIHELAHHIRFYGAVIDEGTHSDFLEKSTNLIGKQDQGQRFFKEFNDFYKNQKKNNKF